MSSTAGLTDSSLIEVRWMRAKGSRSIGLYFFRNEKKFSYQEHSQGVVRLATGIELAGRSVGNGFAGSHSPVDARRLNNLGVAYMNQQMGGKALELFRQAIAADETLAVPHLNAAIALLNSQNTSEARVQMDQAAKLDPDNPRIWYNLGLLERAESNTGAAQRDFASVVRLDPGNADAHYFLGSILIERNDFLGAIPEFYEALRLSPLHASAEFGLARALQRSGSLAEARKHLERFQHITQQKLSSPMGQGYGDQGTYALAEEIKPSPLKAGPMIPVSFRAMRLSASKADVRPTPVSPMPVSGEELQNGICLIDLDGHGKPDLIVLNDGGDGVGFYRHTQQGGYQREPATQHGLQIDDRTVGCAVGDFDNDGHPDLVITTTDRLILYQNRTDDTFRDVTEKAGLKTLNRPSGVTFIDFDHDGDLDLLVAGSSSGKGAGANVLWRNNGNQTFSEWTEQAGLRGMRAQRRRCSPILITTVLSTF
jgi:tetratricopeptide (TPR) repeat protein